MSRSEFDATRALIEGAELTVADDPLEMTVFLPIRDRRYRQAEARTMHADSYPDHRHGLCTCGPHMPPGFHLTGCPREA